MKLARLGAPGRERPAVLAGDRLLDATPIIDDVTPEALAPDSLARIREAADADRLPEIADAHALRVGPPVARPGAIICIGQNYAAHAAESGAEPPRHPIVFLKSPTSLAGPHDDLAIAADWTRVDWEAELAVVIGTRAWRLDSPDQAGAHIAGYATADDVSERTLQLDESSGQWSKGKTAPGFCPLGPWLVTADEFEACDARVRSWVNGQPRQDSTARDMIFGIDALIHDLSQYMELAPGDIVLTGTPQGVALSGRFPYLAPGDLLEVEVEGLGRQRQRVVGMPA